MWHYKQRSIGQYLRQWTVSPRGINIPVVRTSILAGIYGICITKICCYKILDIISNKWIFKINQIHYVCVWQPVIQGLSFVAVLHIVIRYFFLHKLGCYVSRLNWFTLAFRDRLYRGLCSMDFAHCWRPCGYL